MIVTMSKNILILEVKLKPLDCKLNLKLHNRLPLYMIDSVMVHAVFQLESTFGAVYDAGSGPPPFQTLSLALHDVLYPVLGSPALETLPTSAVL